MYGTDCSALETLARFLLSTVYNQVFLKVGKGVELFLAGGDFPPLSSHVSWKTKEEYIFAYGNRGERKMRPWNLLLENLRQNEGNLRELKTAVSCKIKDVHI